MTIEQLPMSPPSVRKPPTPGLFGVCYSNRDFTAPETWGKNHDVRLFSFQRNGIAYDINPITSGFQLQYEHPHGQLFQGDSLDWLQSLNDNSIDLVFADPPYNIGKADWDNFDSQEQYIQWQ